MWVEKGDERADVQPRVPGGQIYHRSQIEPVKGPSISLRRRDPDNVEELVHGSAPWWEAHRDNPIHSIVVF